MQRAGGLLITFAASLTDQGAVVRAEKLEQEAREALASWPVIVLDGEH